MPRKKKSDQVATSDANPPAARDNAEAAAAAPVERPAFEQEGASARGASDPARAVTSPLDDLFTDSATPTDEVSALGRPSRFDCSKLTVMELYALKQEVERYLPPRTLTEVDLVEELLLQYQVAKAMLASVLDNAGVQANQKAQVQNSCVAVLKQVTETQTALYNAEMIKAMEQSLDKAFASAPQHIKEAFYARYEQTLRESATRKQERKAP